MVEGEDIGHQVLHIIVDYRILLDDPKYLAAAHVAHINYTESLGLPGNVNARSSILGVVVYVDLIFAIIVKLEVVPLVTCFLGLQQLLIS